MVLVFREIFLERINPDMIKRGNKMYEMKVKRRSQINPNIIFRDSFNLIPTSLAALVPTFGLNVEDKPFFPHLANKPDNYGKNIYPTPEDYIADGMMIDKRKKFDAWYEQNKTVPFLLDEALASYCTNDVEILTAALIAFQKEFSEVSRRDVEGSGIDVLKESMTIASACMRHFRMNHLKEDHLAIVPERGYEKKDNQSLLALKFLQWYAEKNGVKIQTASNGGEKQVGNFKLDGYIEENKLAIEVNGCVWHACPKCYPEDDTLMPNGKTAGKLREHGKERLEYIEGQGIEVKIFWECKILKMLEKDREMKKRFDEYLDDGPLDIRASFFGGRTGPLKLFHQAKFGEKISYFDVTSLYPYINCTTKYPTGHPKIHILNEEINWTKSDDNPYKLALLKVFIIPPRKIDIPVLPVKFDNERLLFPLCKACSKEFPEGAVKQNYTCSHNDQQRGWVCTCTSIELEAALEEGYIATKIFRVLEYTESDDQLFRSYMSEFMAQKIHSSGFDEKIKGNKEAEDKFIKECAENFGIHIDPKLMIPNKGKRALAKLAVNNLWGRFSLRNFGLSQCLITDNPAELGKFYDDKSIELISFDELTDETILISYIKKKEWVEEHDCSNVIISLWTTSAARLHLLKAMKKVVRSSGCTLLYTDTDSIIYVHPEDQNPLQLGQHLGEFTDEYPHHNILEFCSGGAKQYGLKLQKKMDSSAEYEYVLKVRGLTLNYDVVENQNLRYQKFKEKVLNYAKFGSTEKINVIYPNFLRPSIKDGQITSYCLNKIYRPYVCKGIVCPSTFQILDFGYVNPTHPRILPP
uniref:DNA-directed DNA polymerase n=1 Tax=Meloidogyne incognita TaxID=6306 RepID=A0A914N3G3_MELIC